MKMLMPSNVRAVRQYRDGQPLFSRMGVESQLDAMFSPTVQLRSGGYIVINQTEALVSIDVNSGRSTREHHIEDTALKTNLEAAEEVARQLRLRDLAGLIVIDFIDMDEKRNNRSVERKLSDCLRQDRARIQVGRISHFGLLEMSRQRIRASVLESSTEPCPQCGGSGHVRSVSSVALQLLRGLEEILMKGATHNLVVRTRTDVALYVLNHKRGHLRDLENSFKVTLAVIADPTVSGQQSFIIDRGEQVHTLEAAKALLAAQVAAFPPQIEEAFDEDEPFDAETESEVETEETEGLTDDSAVGEASGGETDADGHKRKRRRRRRGRSGEPREGGFARDDNEVPRVAADRRRSRRCRCRRRRIRRRRIRGPARCGSHRSGAGRRAAAPPSRTSRRTPPARRAGRWSGRIDRRRTRTDVGSGSRTPRLPISTAFRPSPIVPAMQPEPVAPSPASPACGSRSAGAGACAPPRWRPLRKPNEPRGGVRPCAKRSASWSMPSPTAAPPVSRSQPEPSAAAPLRPSLLPRRDRRHPAPPRRMVVAALRQRRIGNLDRETKKPPGKTGRFLFGVKFECGFSPSECQQ